MMWNGINLLFLPLYIPLVFGIIYCFAKTVVIIVGNIPDSPSPTKLAIDKWWKEHPNVQDEWSY